MNLQVLKKANIVDYTVINSDHQGRLVHYLFAKQILNQQAAYP